jgi:hypothetical protein
MSLVNTEFNLNGWPESDEAKVMLMDQISTFSKSKIAPFAKHHDETGDFPQTITNAMSEVVASQQLRKAAENKGEAIKIQAIKEAEAEKERKRLQPRLK